MSKGKTMIVMFMAALMCVVMPGHVTHAEELPRVLFLTKSAGFMHGVVKRAKDAQLAHAEEQLIAAAKGKFIVDATQDCDKINAENLKRYSVVVFYTTGELPISEDGKKALMDFVKSGGGFAGSHCATDTYYKWEEYGKMIGGYFDGHPWHMKVPIKVEVHDHPATRHLGAGFEITDEIYQFKNYSREGKTILMSLDTDKMDPQQVAKGKRKQDNDYAIAWTSRHGKGRVFYTALGHRHEVWSSPVFQQHFVNGILWTMRRGESIFNGHTLDGWKLKVNGNNVSQWKTGVAAMDDKDPRELKLVGDEKGELVNTKGHGRDIYSTYLHGDAVIHLDVMVPKGSNSGVYVMGEYEVQVLDSYGKENLGMGDMGAIYSAKPPSVNACKKPGEWQHYEIHFQAPRFDKSGKKVANARFHKVILNGKVIQENIEMKGPTPGGIDGKEKPLGPLMFQGDHGPVAYRNIIIQPIEDKEKL